MYNLNELNQIPLRNTEFPHIASFLEVWNEIHNQSLMMQRL